MWCSIAELLGTVRGREVVGGHSYGERRSQVRSVMRGRESRGEDEARERVRESQGLRGAPWRRLGGPGKQEVAGARGRARRARAHPPVEDEDDRGGGQWAGPALAAGPARPHRSWAAGKSPSLFLFSFLFSDICFDLVIILNQFITLCQFLQELTILFQSSFIIGIIFGQYYIYIYITIYIQGK